MLCKYTARAVPATPTAKQMVAIKLALCISFSTKFPKKAALIPRKNIASENAQPSALGLIPAFVKVAAIGALNSDQQ